MQPIPVPHVLDPDRILDNDRGDLTVDHETRAHLLDDALHQTCAYAQQLWHDLNAMRGYLLDSLPPDPHAPGPHPTASASPAEPRDDTGWDNWIAAYASVTSVLCGPHGDSGYGLSEARREATLRRSAPSPKTHADNPAPTHPQPTATTPDRPDPATTRDPRRPRKGRTAAKIILILLAVRGIRPRQPAPSNNAASRS